MYLFPIHICYVIDYIKAFTPTLFSSQCFHADEWLSVFVLRASMFGVCSSIKLDVMKDTQSVKSAWSVLYAELKAQIPLSQYLTQEFCLQPFFYND